MESMESTYSIWSPYGNYWGVLSTPMHRFVDHGFHVWHITSPLSFTTHNLNDHDHHTPANNDIDDHHNINDHHDNNDHDTVHIDNDNDNSGGAQLVLLKSNLVLVKSWTRPKINMSQPNCWSVIDSGLVILLTGFGMFQTGPTDGLKLNLVNDLIRESLSTSSQPRHSTSLAHTLETLSLLANVFCSLYHSCLILLCPFVMFRAQFRYEASLMILWQLAESLLLLSGCQPATQEDCRIVIEWSEDKQHTVILREEATRGYVNSQRVQHAAYSIHFAYIPWLVTVVYKILIRGWQIYPFPIPSLLLFLSALILFSIDLIDKHEVDGYPISLL